jgi:plasmid stabilization system protein ParE
MKNRGFIFTETAKLDFANLRAYLFTKAGPKVAVDQSALISKCILRLRRHPESAPVVIKGAVVIRQAVVGNYLIFYTTNADRIAIISIRHSSQERDYDSLRQIANSI